MSDKKLHTLTIDPEFRDLMGFEPRTIYRFHSNALRVVERLMRAEKNS